MATQGTWFGLPDFGITEKLASALGTHQGSWGLPEMGVTEKLASSVSGGNTTDFSRALSQNYPSSSAQVLSAQDSTAGIPDFQNWDNQTTTTTTSGGGGGSTGSTGGSIPPVDYRFYQGWNDQNAIIDDWNKTWQSKLGTTSGGGDPYAALRSEIENLSNTQIAGLDPIRASQEGQVNTSYGQNVADLTNQEQQGYTMLGRQKEEAAANQEKNLKNLAENLRNQFLAGSVMLGARGAGDSSASNMYSFALNKLGSKQRGDVMTQTADIYKQISQREADLKNTVVQEKGRLNTEKDLALQRIGQWYEEQKQNILSTKGQNLTALSESALNTALSYLQNVLSNYQSKSAALDEWAMSNSKTLGELKTKMQSVAGFKPQLPSFKAITGNPFTDAQTFYNAPTGFGFGNEDDRLKNLFG